METKTSKALNLYNNGSTREALAIFRTFKVGLTKEERRKLQIASETLSGNGGIYAQLGIDTEHIISVRKSIIVATYVKTNQ